jgi:hypothetical protein
MEGEPTMNLAIISCFVARNGFRSSGLGNVGLEECMVLGFWMIGVERMHLVCANWIDESGI